MLDPIVFWVTALTLVGVGVVCFMIFRTASNLTHYCRECGHEFDLAEPVHIEVGFSTITALCDRCWKTLNKKGGR